ncbi:MAG: tetratricopeptide repeat protein [Thiomargarita sp.]|nr:tetratricopeptide repeat protein [Thiomargarita sp.]
MNSNHKGLDKMSLTLNIHFPDPKHSTVSLINENDREETKPSGFTSPLSDKGQQYLRWYLEQFATQYSADTDFETAEKIVKQLSVLGKSLFSKVFSKTPARNLFKKFKENKVPNRLLTITTEHPDILSLPWELLQYSAKGFLLDETPPISIRRRMLGAAEKSFTINPKNQLHILFIVSNPDQTDAINPRAEVKAILNGLDKCFAERVTVEFLRPPTLNNLQNRLENRALPHIDILHFNGHSLFDKTGTLENEARLGFNTLSERLKTEAAAIGMGNNTGYFLFENDKGDTHFVPAQLLANLLNRHQIPLLILSAYKGETKTGENKNMDSLAAQLASTGIPFVLAMRYSMLVPATRKFFKRFYKALTQGQQIGTAFDMARLALGKETERREIPRFKERVKIHLQDWFSPSLYQQTPDSALLIPPPEKSGCRAKFLSNNLPKRQATEFFGRTDELRDIERRLIRGTRRITINGVDGEGKTCLAQEAGRWLHNTGLFKSVVYIDFANYQGVDLISMAVSTISSVLGKHLLDVDAVTQALRRTPTLLIFDNLDRLAEIHPNSSLPASPASQIEMNASQTGTPLFQTGNETTDNALFNPTLLNGNPSAVPLQTTEPTIFNNGQNGNSAVSFQTETTEQTIFNGQNGNSAAPFQTGNETTDNVLFNQNGLNGNSGAAPLQTGTTDPTFFDPTLPNGNSGAAPFQTGTTDPTLFNQNGLNGNPGATPLQTGTTDPTIFNPNVQNGNSGAAPFQTGTTDPTIFNPNVQNGNSGAAPFQTGTTDPTFFDPTLPNGNSGAALSQMGTTEPTLFNQNELNGNSGSATSHKGIENSQTGLETPTPKKGCQISQFLKVAKKWSEVGQSRLIIITRQPQNHAAFPSNGSLKHHQLSLKNLEKKEALRYFDAIMQLPPEPVYGVPKREEVERLLERIHYHPLSINLLACQLKNDSLGALNERLNSQLAALPLSMSPQEQALTATLNLALEKLEPHRQWLPKMGLFQNGAFENVLQAITDVPEGQWQFLQQALKSSGLIQPENIEGVSVSFFNFHPRLASKLRERISPTEYQALTARYHQGYYELSKFLYNEEQNNPQQSSAIERKELPNLLNAVYGALNSQTNWAIDFAGYVNSFLNEFGIKSDLEKLTGQGNNAIKQVDENWFLGNSSQGEQLYRLNRIQEAQTVFENILEQLDDETPNYYHSVTLGWIGRCLAEQKQFESSADYFRQSLTELAQLEQSQKVRKELGRMQTYLATVLKEMNDYNGAKGAFEAALSIMRETKDARNEAAIQSQLGSLALLYGSPDEAEQRFRQAQPLFKALNMPKPEAEVLHKLGVAYQNRQQWQAAAQTYLQAAQIREAQSDIVAAIETWDKLAEVNQALGNFPETERWYLKVIEGSKSIRDWKKLSNGFRNVAELLQQTQPHRLGEALKFAEASLSIDKSLAPNESEILKTYTLLAKIADLQNNTAQAQNFRSLARQANVVNKEGELQQHQQLIDAVVQTMTKPELRTQLETMLQQRENKGWTKLVVAIRKILNGERNLDNLCDKECLDLTDAVIIQKILQDISTTFKV